MSKELRKLFIRRTVTYRSTAPPVKKFRIPLWVVTSTGPARHACVPIVHMVRPHAQVRLCRSVAKVVCTVVKTLGRFAF